MTAHRRQFERLAIRHAIGLAKETEGILDTMPFDPSLTRALPSLVQCRTDIDGKAKICSLQILDEGNDFFRFIEDGCDSRRIRHGFQDSIEVALPFATPMHQRIQIL